MNSTPKTLIVHPHGGLGNRMRALVSSLEWAKQNNHRVLLVWEKNRVLNCNYELLFEKSPLISRVINISIPESIPTRFSNLLKIFRYPVLNDAILKRKPHSISQYLFSRFLPPYVHACYEFCSAPILYQQHLIPNSSIQSVMNSAPFIDNEFVGIHIRRGDNAMATSNSPIALFMQAMRSELELRPSCKFYLATDDTGAQSEIQNAFGKDIVFTRAKNLSRNDAAGVVDALIDILMLSRCQYIIGSFYSSFSDVASKYGNIPLQIMKQ